MQSFSEADPEKALAVIKALRLPARPEIFKGPQAAARDIPRAVAVGSQVAEFGPGIAQTLRADIVNSFLVAQLAANSLLRDIGGGSVAWYERYFYVLANAGWTVARPEPVTHQLTGEARELYQEILPIVRAALAEDAANSTVVSVLKSLATVALDKPWMTLFDRESQRALANQFQVSYVDASPGAVPKVKVTSFELDARQSVTQVLFFRFRGGSATLRHSTALLTMNPPVFDRVKPFVEERIREQIGAFIEAVEL